MSESITALASRVGGTARGDAGIRVSRLASIEESDRTAIAPFFRKCSLVGAVRLPAAVLTSDDLVSMALAAGVRSAVVHPSPVIALSILIDHFYPETPVVVGIDETAVVHDTAQIHPTAVIGPRAVVEREVVVGPGSVVGPGAIVCRRSVLGARVRIGPGAVIGHEGFGFVPSPDGPVKVRQVGYVILEDDVEIGANSCVDRGTLGATVIGTGSKLDNLVQVGHNGRIGRGVLVAGQAGLAGSVTVGDGALVGGNAGIADHVTIGPRARIAAKSGVIGNILADATVAGYPAMDRGRWLRSVAKMTKTEKKR